MADHRLDPTGIRPDGSEGDVAQIAGGVVVFGPVSAADLLVTVVDGSPGFVFDSDGQLVYVEVS